MKNFSYICKAKRKFHTSEQKRGIYDKETGHLDALNDLFTDNKPIHYNTQKPMEKTQKRLIAKVKTTNGSFGTPVTTDLGAVYEKMRSGDNEERVRRIAYQATLAVLNGGHDAHSSVCDALPYLLFAGTFGKGGMEDLQTMTHLVMISIGCPEGISRVEQMKARVAQLPYTLLAFVGSSQKTLKVVAECRYGDGYEPRTVDDYVCFLGEAWQTMARLYETLVGCKVQEASQGLLMGCRMSSDKTAIYHHDAQVITIVRKVNDGIADGIQLTDGGEVVHGVFDKQQEQQKMEFYACLDKARGEADSAEETVQALAYYCHKAQLPEEMCLHETMLRWVSLPVSDDLKRRIFRSVYLEPFCDGKPVSQMNEKERIARFIKDFFDRRYELRYNEVKRIEEFRPRNGQNWPWRPLTKRDLKRITFEEMMEGGYGWSIDVETYVQSSLVKSYNPILEFLHAAEQYYDPKRDYIGELARRVPTAYADWEKYFHRWFLAMVAQWTGRSRDFGNAVVPMLIGRQGTHKSTFCKLLLPNALREYYMDDIKMDNAEQVERVLGRMALVNIDEYNAKTDREQAKIKRLLTERDVQVRAMRSEQYTLTSRLCSFIATTNDTQPLPGGDGTRRYLCVEVTDSIDTDTPINYPRLYAQAMHELNAGQPFRFFPHEEAEIQEHNRLYQQQTSATEVLLAYFAPAPRQAQHFMKAVDIQQELARHLRSEDVPNIKQLTVTLKRSGFSNDFIKRQRGWYVKRLNNET